MSANRAELLGASKEAERAMEAAVREYRTAQATYGWDSPKTKEAGERQWEASQKAMRAQRKVLRFDKEQAAKKKPVFVTWKKYGFRHIVATETQPDECRWYDGSKYEQISGIAFCGNDYGIIVSDTSRFPKDHRPDFRATNRPLCGTCKKFWKQLTGEELS